MLVLLKWIVEGLNAPRCELVGSMCTVNSGQPSTGGVSTTGKLVFGNFGGGSFGGVG